MCHSQASLGESEQSQSDKVMGPNRSSAKWHHWEQESRVIRVGDVILTPSIFPPLELRSREVSSPREAKRSLMEGESEKQEGGMGREAAGRVAALDVLARSIIGGIPHDTGKLVSLRSCNKSVITTPQHAFVQREALTGRSLMRPHTLSYLPVPEECRVKFTDLTNLDLEQQ
ncbi:hypothetical protein E2C01_028727 [Portunus trituberculatus]|uniref:Uncharacterized protein n=1 Tax=Portunus trituberculatus TaxID=210409 RepID=A0A5B7EPH5_PORTR|nr:hypothetical protein [Portunus trituberculatus]